jgi:phosphonoacetaldehyde hydrolase
MPRKHHASPIAAVVFDWAGTVVDHGSLAPIRSLQRVFAQREIEVADEVARRDMGLAKRDHIRNLLAEPEVASAWKERYHREATESDAEAVYQEFIPVQTECLLAYSHVIDGVAQVAEELRARGIRIGGTTGYTRAMMEPLEVQARAQGYAPDRYMCPDDVSAGRPHPFMCLRLAADFGAAPLGACVKVGDTLSDIDEGHNAGMWTVGVLRTGNMVGLSAEEWASLPEVRKRTLLERAESLMRERQAHYVANSVAEILPVLEKIAERIGAGERPWQN